MIDNVIRGLIEFSLFPFTGSFAEQFLLGWNTLVVLLSLIQLINLFLTELRHLVVFQDRRNLRRVSQFEIAQRLLQFIFTLFEILSIVLG